MVDPKRFDIPTGRLADPIFRSVENSKAFLDKFDELNPSE